MPSSLSKETNLYYKNLVVTKFNNWLKLVKEKKKQTYQDQNSTVSFQANGKKIIVSPADKFDSSPPMNCSDANSKEVLNRKDVKEEEHMNFSNESFYEKMRSLQEFRNVGLYVYCDSCDKYRYLPDVKDPLDLSDKWYCWMNPDGRYNRCEIKEESIDDKEKELMIFNKYNAGSIVWAKIEGYPWWPAMVEDDPDIENYFCLKDSLEPTHYHVTFFDSDAVTRSWVKAENLKRFLKNIDDNLVLNDKFNEFNLRMDVAIKQAKKAVEMKLLDRLTKYSFIYRYAKSSRKAKRQRYASEDEGGKQKKREKLGDETESSAEDYEEKEEEQEVEKDEEEKEDEI